MRLTAAVVCWSLVAVACSDADDNDCPIHIDAPTDAFAFPDAPPIDAPLLDAPPVDALPIDAVFDTLPPLDAPAVDLLATRAYIALDAVHRLSQVEARIDSYLVDGAWPAGNVGFTPGATCCQAGGVFLCPDNPAAWNFAPWTLYDFAIDGEHGAVYSLTALPAWIQITARIDLDCDGTLADINLRCDRATGETVCNMHYPPALE